MHKRSAQAGVVAQPPPGEAPVADGAQLDAWYGLEPVFEPGMDPRQRPLETSVEIECPHCWQSYASSVDLTLGAQSWVEDCQHCCHPIAVAVEVIDDGRGALVTAKRLDA